MHGPQNVKSVEECILLGYDPAFHPLGKGKVK
jgi:hypothetical protein